MLPRKTVALRSGREVEPVCLTLPDAAEVVGVSESTMRTRLVLPRTGEPEIASFTVGGCRLIWVGELTRWAESRSTASRTVAVAATPPSVTFEDDPDDADLPIAVLRALGRTTRRPRLHAVPRSPPASDAA